MSRKVALFWPGDYRQKPNELALPLAQEATAQMSAALKRLGRESYLVDGFLTRPHESIEKLGPIDDPMIGLFVHWVYGPHTVDGVVGKDNPLLLASNFDGTFPGLVGLLNTGACLESVDRFASRAWTESPNWSDDPLFMERLDEWCSSGRIDYPTDQLSYSAPVSAAAHKLAMEVAAEIRQRRILVLMFGDTSMGMVNGYFGHRELVKHGFTEHKVDQAWLPVRMSDIAGHRVEDALKFVQDRGVNFHWGEKDATDFTPDSTRQQLRLYFAALDLVDEFKADCLGWQYQLGLIPVTAPSDFCEGLLNSACRPESSGSPIITATEADQGNVIPMELMKRVLQKKGLHEAVMFHDVRWGGEEDGRYLWVLLNSGSCGAYAFNHDPDTLQGVHSWRQPSMYFPIPGGTFAGASLPGEITWARTWLSGGELWMDLGRGEVVELPEDRLDHYWQGTTPQWPIMMADLGISQQTLMAHYQSNHIAVAYGDVFDEMLALSRELGFRVRVLGEPGAPRLVQAS